MDLSFFVSLRYLYSPRKKFFHSFINILAVLGISLGITALIVALSIINGFQKNFTQKLFSVNSHITVQLGKNFQKDYKNIESKIQKLKNVKAISPFVVGNGLLKKNNYSSPVLLKGIEKSETQITDITKYLKYGKMFDFEKSGIIVGSALMKELGAFLGDELIFISPNIDLFKFPSIPNFFKFKVSGIFETGIYDIDSKFAFINLKFAQYIFDMPERIHGFGVKLNDLYNFEPLKQKIETGLGIKAFVETWFDLNKGLFSALKMEKIVMTIVLFLIIIVGSFGIVSSLLIMSIEKLKDIGIMKTIGFSKKSIIKIFLYEGLFIGIIGIICGIIFSSIILFFLKNYDFIKLPQEIYFVSRVPVEFKFLESIFVVIGTLLLCILSSLYPAFRAGNADIIEAIRDE